MCIFFNKKKYKNTVVPTCKLPRDYDINTCTPTELFTIVYDNIGESNLQIDKIINQIEFYESKMNPSANKLSDIEKNLIANAVIKCKNMQKLNRRYYS